MLRADHSLRFAHVKHYMLPLRDKAEFEASTFSCEDVESLFNNMEMLAIISQQFLQALEQRFASTDKFTCYGDIILKCVCFFVSCVAMCGVVGLTRTPSQVSNGAAAVLGLLPQVRGNQRAAAAPRRERGVQPIRRCTSHHRHRQSPSVLFF